MSLSSLVRTFDRLSLPEKVATGTVAIVNVGALISILVMSLRPPRLLSSTKMLIISTRYRSKALLENRLYPAELKQILVPQLSPILSQFLTSRQRDLG